MSSKAKAERGILQRSKTPATAKNGLTAAPAGIKAIHIRNFRCFERLDLEGCARINVVVGDNGSGKTALFEAIFLALSGSIEVSLRLRAQRGMELTFAGPPRSVEEAAWKDYFYGLDWNRSIEITLKGSGLSARSLSIFRSPGGQILIPADAGTRGAATESSTTVPLVFKWTDSSRIEHTATARITPQGVQITTPPEDLPDFFLFSANQTVGSGENATRFSELSRNRQERTFVSRFVREYPWIENLNIEVLAGQPIIHATLKDTPVKLPVNMVSGGVNRILGIMLALASRPNSVVIVDEMENGLFHEHKAALWRSVIDIAREQDSQMFLSTHDEEWITALMEAAGNEVDDIALFRLQRSDDGKRMVRRIPGRLLKGAVELGGEVR